MRHVLIWKGDSAVECKLEGIVTGKMTVVAHNAEEMIVVTRTAGRTVRTSRAGQPTYFPVKFTVWKVWLSLSKDRWKAESVCDWTGTGGKKK